MRTNAIELKARMDDWPSLRPVVHHIYEDTLPPARLDSRTLIPGHYFAWLLLKGEVILDDRNGRLFGKTGDWVIAHPGPRRHQFSEGARIISIRFQARWPDGQPLFDEGLSTVIPSKEAPALEKAARELLDFARSILPSDPFAINSTLVSLPEYFGFQHRGSAYLVTLFDILMKRGLIPSRLGKIDERLLSTLRRLDAWPLDLPLDLDHIARLNGLTPDHLARLFQEHFDLSPAKYFAHRRKEYARQLLAHSSAPVKTIALDLGFHSIADFSAWFRRGHEMSPSTYRQRVAQAHKQQG